MTGYVSVFIHNLTTNEKMSWYLEVKPKWKTPIKPSDIRELIETKKLWGIDAKV